MRWHHRDHSPALSIRPGSDALRYSETGMPSPGFEPVHRGCRSGRDDPGRPIQPAVQSDQLLAASSFTCSRSDLPDLLFLAAPVRRVSDGTCGRCQETNRAYREQAVLENSAICPRCLLETLPFPNKVARRTISVVSRHCLACAEMRRGLRSVRAWH